MQSIGDGRTSSQANPNNGRSHNTAERINRIAKVLHSVLPSRPRELPQRLTRAPRPNNWAPNDPSVFRR